MLRLTAFLIGLLLLCLGRVLLAQAAPPPVPPGAPTASLASRTVVIDPAHALRSADGTVISLGSVGAGNAEEQAIVLNVGGLLGELVEKAGGRVAATRSADNPWRVGQDAREDNMSRGELANTVKADAFIRLHCDASEDRLARGVSVGYISESSRPLAEAVLETLSRETGSPRQGVFLRHEYGLDVPRTPAISVQLGVLSTAEDEVLLTSEDFQRRAAQGIFDGLVQYLGSSDATSGVQAAGPARPTAVDEAGQALLETLVDIVQSSPLQVGLVTRNPETAEAAMVQGNVPFPSLGLMRLVVLVEATRQVQGGTIHPGRVPEGEHRTVFQLVQAMIRDNDADAADRLMRILGKSRLENTMTDLGLKGSRLDHDFRVELGPGVGPRNMTTAEDMVSLLERVDESKLVSAEGAKAIYALLGERSDSRMIGSLSAQGAQVAHLAAQGQGAAADAGIVSASGVRYVFAVLVTGPSGVPAQQLTDTASRLAAAAHEHFLRTFAYVETDPPGVKVAVNGHIKGISPCLVQITSATPTLQDYTFSAQTDDGGKAEKTARVKQGDRLDVSLTVKPSAAKP